MGAALAWLDYDTSDRDRMNRILALFQERDTRDELGIGTIRDLIADTLFPGTSTIQTRLRYMLFVPWAYKQLEAEGWSSFQIAREARKREITLVSALMEGDDTAGVFGRRAGGKLDRLPSAVYWSGLGTWGILRFDGSQDRYHTGIDDIYQRRKRRDRAQESTARRGEGTDAIGLLTGVTWHPKLPPVPSGFPESAMIDLDRDEADFLRDQIVTTQPKSLLARLALLDKPTEVEFPWEHPRMGSFSPEHRDLLHHARLLSAVSYGAAILYNLMLAEQKGAKELVKDHRATGSEWAKGLDYEQLGSWSLDWTRPLESELQRLVPTPTRDFVLRWLKLTCAKRGSLFDDSNARALIRAREMRLKGPRSRFTNQRSLDQWSGYAGMVRLSYRWPTVTRFMLDLHEGLRI